jgi:hypothetical protein
MKKFMCGVTFDYELGETDDIHLYDTLEELKNSNRCHKGCGIVEIEFDTKPEEYTSHKWVLPGKPWTNSKQDPEAKKGSDQ